MAANGLVADGIIVMMSGAGDSDIGISLSTAGISIMMPRMADHMAWRRATLAVNQTQAATNTATPMDRSIRLPKYRIKSCDMSLSLHLSALDLLNKFRELVGADNFVVNHTNHESFNRSATESIDDVAHGLHSQIGCGLGSGINKGAALNPVRDVAFFFEPDENGSRG